MRFSADQALEAHEEGEPILISRKFAYEMLKDHGALAEGLADFRAQVATCDEHDRFDAWEVLAWLGY
jgi:hypothetical protein